MAFGYTGMRSRFFAQSFLSTFAGRLKQLGMTFFKDFENNQATGNADFSLGSNEATFTASRSASTPATFIDSNGVVNATTTSNELRFTSGYYATNGIFTVGSSLLLEGASTNLLIHSIFDADAGSGLATGWSVVDDVTNVLTTTLISETVTNISGSQAQRLEQTFGDGTFFIIFSANSAVGSLVQDEKATFSVWLKGSITADSVTLSIQEKDSAGVSGTRTDSADIKATLSSTEWKRFEFTMTSVDADASRFNAQIRVMHSGTGSMDLNIVGAQVEQASYPSSLIPTTSAALTRNIEVLTYITASNFVGGDDGTIAISLRPVMLLDELPSDNLDFILIEIDSDNNWNFNNETSAGNNYRFRTESGGVTLSADGTADPYDGIRYSLHSVIGTYSTTSSGGDKIVVYDDGVDDGSNADYTTPIGSLPTNIQIQSSAGQAMMIDKLAFFNKRLSATEALEVHNLFVN